MARFQLNETLLRFPLFNGMGHSELTQLVAHTRFEFMKLFPGERLVAQGEPAKRLFLVTNGTFRRQTESADGGYAVEEVAEGPFMMPPDRLFGLEQVEQSTLTATSEASIVALGKSELFHLCNEFLAIRINLVNIFATRAQQLCDQLWRKPPSNLRENMVRFFVAHCSDWRGTKVFLIHMDRIAAEVNDSRLNVSRELKAMREDGLVECTRGRIIIPDLEKLLLDIK